MALTKPVLYSVAPFDATKQYIFHFNVIGGDQVVSNTLVIQRNDTLENVYEDTQETFKYEHTLPEDTLKNGVSYQAYLITKNYVGDDSVESNVVLFSCFDTPVVSFTNIPTDSRIENSSYNFTVSYNQIQGELLNTYTFNLYNGAGGVIATSGIKYSQSTALPITLSHIFSGFDNNSEYYVELVGETNNGMVVASDKVRIITVFQFAQVFSEVTLENDCNNGYIIFNSNVMAIDGVASSTPIYINGNSIDLRDGVTVTWGAGYEILNGFTARIWGTNFENDSEICSFSTIYGDDISIRFFRSENNMWAELYVTNKNLMYQYLIKSSEITASVDDNIFIWLRHENSLYDIIVDTYSEVET